MADLKTRTALTGAPDLHDYDWVLANTSGGKDSTALLVTLFEHAATVGYPTDRIIVVHADLGAVEWPGVRELAAEHAAHFDRPLDVVWRRDPVTGKHQDLLDYIVTQRRMWPGSTTRFCTSDCKTGPVARLHTALADAVRTGNLTKLAALLPADRVDAIAATATVRRTARADGPARILDVLGMRAQESPARAKRPAYCRKRDTRATVVDEWLPIHDWSVERVWATIRTAGLRIHQAYELGMPRLSCAFCVYAGKDALAIATRELPELADRYAAVEREIGHTFRHGFSIADHVDDVRSGRYQIPVRVEGWAA